MGLDADVAGEVLFQRRGVLRMQLAKGEAVGLAHQPGSNQRRARILHQRFFAQRGDPGRERGVRIFGGQHAGDAVPPLAGLLRLDAREIGFAGAGMGVEQEEGFVLQLHVLDDEGEDAVLHHIGEIAGVIGVAVIHGVDLAGFFSLAIAFPRLRARQPSAPAGGAEWRRRF